MNLDFSPKELKKRIDEVADLLTDYFAGLDEKPVFPGMSPGEVRSVFNESLPEEGQSVEALLRQVEQDVLETVTNNAGPRYYGYITGGGNQVAVLAEMIKASLNQNNLKWHSSPASTEMERLVCRWLAEWIGYPETGSGVLVDGGSVANFEALAIARTAMGPELFSREGLYGSAPMTVYVSSEGHSSLEKAMDILGMGRKYLRKVPVDDRFRVNIEQLELKILRDKQAGLNPICVVGIAGTTNTGAVDPLDEIAGLCKKYDLWFHVDAAYGGPAARLDSKKELFQGIGKADSVIVNPHKWLYVPFGASAVLVRNQEHQRRTFSLVPDYLKSDPDERERTDLMEYNLPLTKEFRALKIWMTIKAYGADTLVRAIGEDIAKAEYLCGEVNKRDKFELLAPAPLSIACFRYNPGKKEDDELDALNKQLVAELEQDGRVFLTGTRIRNAFALRVCFINHRSGKEDVDYLLDTVEEVASEC